MPFPPGQPLKCNQILKWYYELLLYKNGSICSWWSIGGAGAPPERGLPDPQVYQLVIDVNKGKSSSVKPTKFNINEIKTRPHRLIAMYILI